MFESLCVEETEARARFEGNPNAVAHGDHVRNDDVDVIVRLEGFLQKNREKRHSFFKKKTRHTSTFVDFQLRVYTSLATDIQTSSSLTRVIAPMGLSGSSPTCIFFELSQSHDPPGARLNTWTTAVERPTNTLLFLYLEKRLIQLIILLFLLQKVQWSGRQLDHVHPLAVIPNGRININANK